jgi:hypothetical protein
MISRHEAQWLVEFDAIVADLQKGDAWLENASLYAVTARPRAKQLPTPRRSSEMDEAAVIFVHKASGQVEQTPYADVSTLLETMRPVD